MQMPHTPCKPGMYKLHVSRQIKFVKECPLVLLQAKENPFWDVIRKQVPSTAFSCSQVIEKRSCKQYGVAHHSGSSAGASRTNARSARHVTCVAHRHASRATATSPLPMLPSCRTTGPQSSACSSSSTARSAFSRWLPRSATASGDNVWNVARLQGRQAQKWRKLQTRGFKY